MFNMTNMLLAAGLIFGGLWFGIYEGMTPILNVTLFLMWILGLLSIWNNLWAETPIYEDRSRFENVLNVGAHGAALVLLLIPGYFATAALVVFSYGLYEGSYRNNRNKGIAVEAMGVALKEFEDTSNAQRYKADMTNAEVMTGDRPDSPVLPLVIGRTGEA